MEPEKFEEHIKDQFRKREIKPSEGSWAKLESRLNESEKPAGSKFPWIAGVAAVAVVFFILGTLYNSPVKTTPEVVETNAPEVIKKDIPVVPASEILEIKEETPAVVENIKSEAVPLKEAQKPQKPVRLPAEKTAPKAEIRIAENSVELPEEKTAEEIFQANREYSIESEVDALLLAANAEIENDPDYDVQTVSANALLNEVEHELEMNFRQKVFEVLKDGFSKAKTAVANRN